jgi:hypothetical protein
MKPVWGLINKHDRAGFAVHLLSEATEAECAAAGYRPDPRDTFVMLRGLDNDEAAERVVAAELDVLVDLNGYSAPGRLAIVASHPARIVVAWFNQFARWYSAVMAYHSPMYLGIQSLLILFFTYFYSQISFNPIDISKNIQQYGGFIPGIRPGKPTSDYLMRVSNRVNLFSALFFMLLALIPSLFTLLYGSNTMNPFGATSVLIMVGVALETSKQIEAQMLMRHYKGFLT